MYINHINNIKLNSLNNSKTRQIKHQSTPIKNYENGVDLRKLPFHYPIAFGSRENVSNRESLSFDKSVENH